MRRSCPLRPRELTVEAEGDVVRDPGASDLFEGGGVEDEQERRAAVTVEYDGEQDAVVLPLSVGSGDEHRLAGIGTRLVR